MFSVKEINDKDTWENFFNDIEDKTFLQSWNWGEFQEKMGNKIWRLGIYSGERSKFKIQDSNLVALALVSKIVARRGSFLLIQHGPTIKNPKSKIPNPKSKILKVLLEELKRIGKEEKISFIRMNPLLEDNEENRKIFKDLGFKNAPMHANAYESTWKLNILPSEEELLAKMRKTTRYLIRKTSKNPDIFVKKSEDLRDIEVYNALTQKVAKRQDFVPFSSGFIKNEFDTFLKEKETILFLGKYKNEIAAGALIIFWSGVAFYHQAASNEKYSKFSIPYLIIWEAIKEAKKRGCKCFDFWGYVDPFKNKNHPWAGPTLFKMGFGGEKKEYIKTQDFPLSIFYFSDWIIETIRRKKRKI
ncbi:MAG TPA: peptidoglycan bridge formation glycyltransferase FemA/FemB family protein [Candidatus Pacearchaeota archaeon]|nr:peptidoglycan bridge formation glycyltransferase FemA/FemB family protein [Candidatus Pacearchaeota archaeon]HOK94295.1 peptidoglycan bridge formation glycyltransferase FemA/FemB family protein [Candidatus Pacearchaeota archaeon]HPO75429.1 peptidoglycan bridge formation glycyltransferase FemA/FemB family protein [Candidatus Pacearchaeota archaeon]